MTARSLRALRGLSAAGIATFLAAVSHTLGGGAAPSVVVILAVSVLATPIATVVIGRRLNVWRLSVAVLLSQLAFHGAFSVIGGASMSAMTAGVHQHHEISALPAVADVSVVAAADPLMLFAHLIAVVVSVAVLHRGEGALRSLLSLVIELVARRLRIPATREGTLALPAAASERRSILITHLSCALGRRGPPVLSPIH